MSLTWTDDDRRNNSLLPFVILAILTLVAVTYLVTTPPYGEAYHINDTKGECHNDNH